MVLRLWIFTKVPHHSTFYKNYIRRFGCGFFDAYIVRKNSEFLELAIKRQRIKVSEPKEKDDSFGPFIYDGLLHR